MAGQVVSPRNSMRINNRNAARKIQNGSPKIREVLRQRCRERIHERRDEIFSKRRLGYENSVEIKNALTEILHEEFDNITARMKWIENFPQNDDQTYDLQDEMIDIEETIEEQWILEEYEKMLWEEKEIKAMLTNNVMCPICNKSLLQETNDGMVICNCGLRLQTNNGLQGLSKNIQELVNAHSANCLEIPKFSVFQENMNDENISLCFSCFSCETFSLV